MNLRDLSEESTYESFNRHVWGLLLGCLSLVAWTWYVLYNTRFLQSHPEVNPKQFTLLVGITTLAFAVLGLSVRLMTIDTEYLAAFSPLEETGQSFLIGIVTLGIVCSWIAYTLWNVASAKLPSLISGQIAILEMVFSLLFVYLYRQAWPMLEEVVGIGFILIGIWMGLVRYYGDETSKQMDTET